MAKWRGGKREKEGLMVATGMKKEKKKIAYFLNETRSADSGRQTRGNKQKRD